MFFRPARPGLSRRIIAAVSGLVFFATGCIVHSWAPTPLTQIAENQKKAGPRIMRFGTDSGQVSLRVEAVDLPYVMGPLTGGLRPIEFDIRTAKSVDVVTLYRDGSAREVVEKASLKDSTTFMGKAVRFKTATGLIVFSNVTAIHQPWVSGTVSHATDVIVRFDTRLAKTVEAQVVNGAGSVLATMGVLAGVGAIAVLIVALTKSSCPFVYVDRGAGYEFVGEAYSGAAFRATKRDDLLPIPSRDTGTVRVLLRNEALETQYTDRAELVLVDHAPGVRALATFDGQPILVRSAVPPAHASEARAGDVTSELSARDGRAWVTGADKVATIDREPFADELTATFALPATGTPVLELFAGNTPWLDLVFGRFFAAMGDHLSTYLAQGSDSAAGPPINRWRTREGVDLTVEMKAAGGWQRVAIVPTVGPATMRELAIPLPGARTAPSDSITVRLHGGLGFWRVDQMALSVLDGATAVATRVPARTARGTGGRDERSTIAATDERSNALSEMNETLELEFQLPPLARGQTRSAFLFTNGYYNVHPPIQAEWRPLMLKTIRDEPGALSRFGRDLARAYARTMAATATAPAPARR